MFNGFPASIYMILPEFLIAIAFSANGANYDSPGRSRYSGEGLGFTTRKNQAL